MTQFADQCTVPWRKQPAMSGCVLGYAPADEETPDYNPIFQGRHELR